MRRAPRRSTRLGFAEAPLPDFFLPSSPTQAVGRGVSGAKRRLARSVATAKRVRDDNCLLIPAIVDVARDAEALRFYLAGAGGPDDEAVTLLRAADVEIDLTRQPYCKGR